MKVYRRNEVREIKFHVGFEVLTAASMNSTIFRDVTQCNPLEVHRRLGEICLYFQGREVNEANNEREANSKLTTSLYSFDPSFLPFA
jgi:hypothetical protein